MRMMIDATFNEAAVEETEALNALANEDPDIWFSSPGGAQDYSGVTPGTSFYDPDAG